MDNGVKPTRFLQFINITANYFRVKETGVVDEWTPAAQTLPDQIQEWESSPHYINKDKYVYDC